MNSAAEGLLQALGSPTPTAAHAQAHIAAVACTAGFALHPEATLVDERLSLAQRAVYDSRYRESTLLVFMHGTAAIIDPGINPGPGLREGGWDGVVPREHASLIDSTMIGMLGELLYQLSEQHGISPLFRAHVAALAAMKLIASSHKSGLLDQKTGKALARHYLIVGGLMASRSWV